VTKISVLFVCLGDICRSPTAEGIFRHLATARGVHDRFVIDSAGTSGFHAGDASDPRTLAAAKRRGLAWTHRSRQVHAADWDRFDLLVAMDRKNHRDLIAAAPSEAARAKVVLLRTWDDAAGDDLDVPDPYYGGDRGFEDVLDLCDRACSALLDHLLEKGVAAPLR
jgi:protein-tyrosine phosphatase